MIQRRACRLNLWSALVGELLRQWFSLPQILGMKVSRSLPINHSTNSQPSDKRLSCSQRQSHSCNLPLSKYVSWKTHFWATWFWSISVVGIIVKMKSSVCRMVLQQGFLLTRCASCPDSFGRRSEDQQTEGVKRYCNEQHARRVGWEARLGIRGKYSQRYLKRDPEGSHCRQNLKMSSWGSDWLIWGEKRSK